LNSDKINDEICEGDSIVFSATKGYSNYKFIKNDTLTVQNSGSETFSTKALKGGDKFIVIATNKDGCSAPSNQLAVTINALPVAHFGFSQAFLQFNFIDSTANSVSRLWNFGDSQTDTVKNPVHTYAAAGLYDVKLSVVDDNGCKDETQKKVNAIINSIAALTPKSVEVRYIKTANIIEVKYELLSPSLIKINLLNQSGKLIKSVQQDMQQKGLYSLAIPAGDLTKGIYFVSLINGSSISSKKILID
jgi:PKD repeat protein